MVRAPDANESSQTGSSKTLLCCQIFLWWYSRGLQCIIIYYSLRGATTLLVAAVATGCNLLVVQARYRNSFQLTHMPCGNHAQSIASNGGQREDKKLLQCSQLGQHGKFQHVSISERQRSRRCDQKLCVPFLRTVATDIGSRKERSSNGSQRRDKSVHISTIKMSFSTNFLRSGQCMIAITAV